PSCLDFVGTGKETGVAFERIEQETLVCLGNHSAEFTLVAEVERGLTESHAGVGNFGLEFKLYSFGRLHLNDEAVGVDYAFWPVRKKHVRRLVKLDDNLSRAARHRFAAAKIEWHALPAPIVDPQLDCGECSGVTAWADSIAGGIFAV